MRQSFASEEKWSSKAVYDADIENLHFIEIYEQSERKFAYYHHDIYGGSNVLIVVNRGNALLINLKSQLVVYREILHSAH